MKTVHQMNQNSEKNVNKIKHPLKIRFILKWKLFLN